jgi:hypothetical protein
VLLTAAGIGLACALVGVAWLVDRGRAPAPRPTRVRERPVAELVTPAPLDDRERNGTGPRFGSQESVRLQSGVWVQVADPAGNLKQQYTASRIDPLPDKRLAMAEPRAVLYGDGGRIVTMRSDSMTARIPKRELESGRLVGNVVIRVYRPVGDRPVDLKADAPDVVIESPEASFDSLSGEIRCDRQVRITGEVITFEGEGLSLDLSADGRSIERLVVDRATAPVRIVRAAVEAQAERRRAREREAPAHAEAPKAQAPAAKAAADASPTPASARPRGAAARGSADQPTKPATPAQAPPGDGRLFRLTLNDSVEVVSLDAGRRTVVRGDRLDAFFVLGRGSPIGLSSAAVDEPADAGPVLAAMPGGLAHRVAAVAFAAVVPQPSPDDTVTVTYRGKLVLAPAPEGTPALAVPDAVRVTVTGAPAVVTDSSTEATITAASATFESRAERMLIEGRDGAPAQVASPDLTLIAPRFELDRAAGRGAGTGPGRVVLGPEGRRRIAVEWKERMTLALQPGTGDAKGSFRGADFTGGVVVNGTDFELRSDALAVEAAPAGDRDVPRRIVARGNVRARSLGASGGRFEAGTVDIALTPDADGQAQPRILVATGGVTASDDAQTLWCSSLRASFVERGSGRPSDAAAPGEGPAVAADIGPFTAEGPVEVRTGDGARAYAARLEGDGAAGTARLVGPDILVVRGNLVLDQLAELQLQQRPARASAIGPGRASGFRDPVMADRDGPVGRPAIKGLPQMQVTWRDSLAYEEGGVPARGGEPAKGLLLVQGSVKVRASRAPAEAEALDADEVQLELLANDARTGSGDGASTVSSMKASGSVRLEAREWADASRGGTPRLFRMNAPSVAYDVRAGTAFVDGAGTLLVHDPREAAPAPAPAPVDGATQSPFSPQGTTRFSWKRSLSVERRPNGDSRVILEREALMEHLGDSDAATGTVAADRLMATIRGTGRPGTRPSSGDMAMQLGGPAEVTEVAADGRVVIRTEQYDIDANEFELDVPSQVGAARAEPGRLVTVVRRGQAAPLRGHAFRWDLVKGTLAVEGARGSIGR